jgi:hypothetical protein
MTRRSGELPSDRRSLETCEFALFHTALRHACPSNLDAGPAGPLPQAVQCNKVLQRLQHEVRRDVVRR